MKNLYFILIVAAVILAAFVGCSYDITEVNQEVKGGETLPLVPTADLNKMIRLSLLGINRLYSDCVSETDILNCEYNNYSVTPYSPDIKYTVESGSVSYKYDANETTYTETAMTKLKLKDISGSDSTTLTNLVGSSEVSVSDSSVVIEGGATYTSDTDEFVYLYSQMGYARPTIGDFMNSDYSLFGYYKSTRITNTSMTNNYYGEVKEGAILEITVSHSTPTKVSYGIDVNYTVDFTIKLSANVDGEDVLYEYDSVKEAFKVGTTSYRCPKELFLSTYKKLDVN